MYNILCYGDSNTWGVNPEDNFSRVSYKDRWTQIMKRELGEDYCVFEEGLPGRTTVFEDPFGYGRHGEKAIDISLYTHNPLDVLVIMLGTNDMKDIYNASAEDSACGMERVVIRAKNLLKQLNSENTRILVVSPIHVGVSDSGNWFYGFSSKSIEKSKQLARYYKEVSVRQSCEFMDASKYASPGGYDGIHIANADNEALGKAFAQKIRTMIS